MSRTLHEPVCKLQRYRKACRLRSKPFSLFNQSFFDRLLLQNLLSQKCAALVRNSEPCYAGDCLKASL
jgi:hypothetical protein